jgi:hypothetical protein
MSAMFLNKFCFVSICCFLLEFMLLLMLEFINFVGGIETRCKVRLISGSLEVLWDWAKTGPIPGMICLYQAQKGIHDTALPGHSASSEWCAYWAHQNDLSSKSVNCVMA